MRKILIIILIVLFMGQNISYAIDSHDGYDCLRIPSGSKATYSRIQYDVGIRRALSSLEDPKLREFIALSIQNLYSQFDVPQDYITRLLEILVANYKKEPGELKKRLRDYIIKVGFIDYYNTYKSKSSLNKKLDFVKENIKGPVVADIGCGKGKLSEQIVRNFAEVEKVIATDPENYHEIYDSRVEFRQQRDRYRIPIESNSVDTVILSYVVHHIQKDKQLEFFNEINRILKVNGKVILLEDSFSLFLGHEEENDLLKSFLSFDSKQKNNLLAIADWLSNAVFDGISISLPFAYRSAEEWENIFVNTGFSVEEERFVGMPKLSSSFAPRVFFVLNKEENLLLSRNNYEDILAYKIKIAFFLYMTRINNFRKSHKIISPSL